MKEWKQVGTVPVESGRVAIIDPCYIANEHSIAAHVHDGKDGDGLRPVFTFEDENGNSYLAVQLNIPAVTAMKRKWQAELDARNN